MVQVIGNTVYQGQNARGFALKLSNVINKTAGIFGGAGRGVIVEDDPKPSISVSGASVVEGNGGTTPAAVTVTLSGQTIEQVTVDYRTADGTASEARDNDYVAATGTLTFAPGETEKTVTVMVVGDTRAEDTEKFSVVLSGATNATVAVNRATVTIVDDDSTTWATSSAGDFGTGSLGAGAFISKMTNGEITLAPALGTDFGGNELAAGWTSTTLATGGGVTWGGSAAVDGAILLGPSGFGPGRSLEFLGRFNGTPGQNAGFGTASGAPFAMFGTTTQGTLLARSLATGTPVETPITVASGTWFNKSHKFRIDWNAGNIVYWVDDKKVATHNLAISSGMQPVAIDATVGDGAVVLQYLRVTPYAAAGSYTSGVFDAGAVVTWQTASWNATVPAGTGLVIRYRTGTTPTPDETWTAFTSIPASGGALSGSSRYLQFRVEETTTDVGQTPVLQDVTVAFQR
jgi:hypothetical protein